jgi:hypothetical protein
MIEFYRDGILRVIQNRNIGTKFIDLWDVRGETDAHGHCTTNTADGIVRTPDQMNPFDGSGFLKEINDRVERVIANGNRDLLVQVQVLPLHAISLFQSGALTVGDFKDATLDNRCTRIVLPHVLISRNIVTLCVLRETATAHNVTTWTWSNRTRKDKLVMV